MSNTIPADSQIPAGDRRKSLGMQDLGRFTPRICRLAFIVFDGEAEIWIMGTIKRGESPLAQPPPTIMSESYAALTLLSETPNAHAREILSKVANGDWDLATALGETALACLDAPGHEGWEAAGDALAACANLAWAS